MGPVPAPPPEPTSPFPSSILPTRHPECGERLPGPQGRRPAPRFPDAACPMLPPVGGEGRGGSGVTGQPPVHVTWVAAPWCRRVTPPQNPAQTLTPALAVPPRGAARGPLPSVRKPRSLGKTVAHETEAALRARGREAATPPGARLPRLNAGLLRASFLPPSGRPGRSPAHWPLPFAAASPLLIDKQPGLHRATRRPGARGPDGAICHTRLPATVPAHTLTLIVGARSGSACARGAEPCLPPGSYPGVWTGVLELLTT